MTATPPVPVRDVRLDVQGMRALAVLLVVLYHAGLPGLPGGYVGVDVFFVISGFLITSHLVGGLVTRGSVDFRGFYARRIRRILPASFAVLVASVVLAPLLVPPLELETLAKDATATALYVPNMLFLARGTNYLSDPAPSLFQHYWSLGVEEQFYVFWPLALVLAWRLTRRRRGALTATVAVLSGASFLLGVWLTHRNQPVAFFSLPTRAWEFGAGAALALAPPVRLAAVRSGRIGAALAWLGMGLVLASGLVFDAGTPFPGWHAAVPVVGAALVMGAADDQTAWGPTRVLRVAPLQFLGAISYSLYLVHWPALVLPAARAGRAPPLWSTLLIAAACVPLAWLLFRFVETPFRRPVGSVHRQRVAIRWAAATAAGVAVVTALGSVGAAALPLSDSGSAPSMTLQPWPHGWAVVPANLRPSLHRAGADIPPIYLDGCHRSQTSVDSTPCHFGSAPGVRRVALFGDSHAAQWFPALKPLADSGQISLDVFTKSSCAAVAVPGSHETPSCPVWRSAVLTVLRHSRYDLVLVGDFERSLLSVGTSEQAVWRSALGRFFDTLGGDRVLLLSDTPYAGATPAICLSAHLTDAPACAIPVTRALRPDLEAVDESVAGAHGQTVFDATPLICNGVTCPAIIGDVLVYRDTHHLTATFVASFAGRLGSAIVTADPTPGS